jgi:uncharacterized membrane protein YeaQ/YmgE (transglycosylase-associated protein family)
VGGYIFALAGIGSVTGVNLESIVIAIIGAIVVLVVYRFVIARA